MEIKIDETETLENKKNYESESGNNVPNQPKLKGKRNSQNVFKYSFKRKRLKISSNIHQEKEEFIECEKMEPLSDEFFAKHLIDLPEEILCEILSFLDLFSFFSFRLVCRLFHRISESYCKLIVPYSFLGSYLKKRRQFRLPTCFIYGVTFSSFFFTTISKKQIQSLPSSVHFVDLSCTLISPKVIHLLPQTIRKLYLICCENVIDEHILYLPTQLVDLRLSGCKKLTGKTFANLPSSLQTLYLDFCESLIDDALFNLPSSLTYLNLCNSKGITNLGLSQFHSPLIELNLSGNVKMDQNGIQNLANSGCSSSLKILDLSYCFKINDISLSYLDRYFTALEVLKICEDNRITIEGLKKLNPKIKVQFVNFFRFFPESSTSNIHL